MAIDSKEIKDDLDRFENLIKMINFDYERFFAKIIKHPPLVYVREVNKIIAKYNLNSINNTTLRFKFNNLVARYLTFRDKWNKKMMEYEGVKKSIISKLDEIKEMVDENVQTKIDYSKELEKLPTNINKDKIAKIIEDKIKEYRSKGIENLDIQINIVDNKPKLIIKPKS
ncbi:MAG: hypothetical protein K6348_03230 [Deferribacterales bacterium]